MKISHLIPALACLSLCSCSDEGQRLPMGEGPAWVSPETARGICAEFLKGQGSTNAHVTGEAAMAGKMWYTFETNGITAPIKVMVDRNSRKVGYGDWKP